MKVTTLPKITLFFAATAAFPMKPNFTPIIGLVGALAVGFGLGGWSNFLMGQEKPANGTRRQAPRDEELPHVKALSPRESLATFKLDPGLRIELAAAEPNVADPVDIAFDEDGRMWVAELWNYPGIPKKGEPLGRVRVLESTTGDGVYDKSTIFAENIIWPSGVLPWDGGVFVVSSPDLLYLKDTKGTGHPDVIKRVYTGFHGKTYEIANCMRWGMDNKIYVCGSYAGGSLRPADKPDAPPVSSRDFRFDPRGALAGEPPEAVSGSGEWGNTFNDWGDRFTCDATDPVFHAVIERDVLQRNPYLLVSEVRENANKMWAEIFPISQPEPWKVARQKYWQRWVDTNADMHAGRFPSNELAPHGFATSAAGVTAYRGSALGEAYRNNCFTGEPANNVVVRMVLAEHGASFSADRPVSDVADKREFLASTDDRFRPVNLADGPDGCLYVVSMYREIIEDETAIPGEILKHYDLYRGRDMGRIYRITPEKFSRPRLPHLSTATVSELVRAVQSPDGWTRDTAQRLLYQRHEKSAIEPLRAAVRNAPLAQARIQAMYTLAGLGDRDAATLATAAADAEAHVRQTALHLAGPVLARSESLRKLAIDSARDENPRVRFHAALALGQFSSPASLQALAAIARHDGADRWTRTAVLISVPDRAGELLHTLIADADFLKHPGASELLDSLANVVGIRHDSAEVGATFAAIGSPDIDDNLRQSLVRQLADGLSRGGGLLATEIAQAPPAVRKILDELLVSADKTARDPSRKGRERVDAIRLLAFAPPKQTSELFNALLQPSQPNQVQAEVIHAMSGQEDPAMALVLVKLWSRVGPSLRNDLLDAIYRRPERIAALLDAIENKKVPAGEIEPARRQALLSNKDEAIRERAAKVFQGQIKPDRQKTIEHYTEAVAKLSGDRGQGQAIFKSVCFQCHGKGASGERVGSDLALLEDRSPPTLLVAILDPNREVKPIYVAYDLETRDGQDFLGVIVNETANSVTIRRAGGIDDVVLRTNIKGMRSTGLSLMPDGLEAGINEQQMADLLQFLQDFREH